MKGDQFERRSNQKTGTDSGNDQFLRNEPMKKHITFRVGGPAACFLMPSTKEQIEEIVHICQEERTALLYSWKWKQSAGK